jgi:hypothetical protein
MKAKRLTLMQGVKLTFSQFNFIQALGAERENVTELNGVSQVRN